MMPSDGVGCDMEFTTEMVMAGLVESYSTGTAPRHRGSQHTKFPIRLSDSSNSGLSSSGLRPTSSQERQVTTMRPGKIIVPKVKPVKLRWAIAYWVIWVAVIILFLIGLI